MKARDTLPLSMPAFQGERPRRRRARHGRRIGWRRALLRLLAHFSLGVFLVGCAHFGHGDHLEKDPMFVLRHSQDGDARTRAYRKLADPAHAATVPHEDAIRFLTLAAVHEHNDIARAEATRALRCFDGPDVESALAKASNDSSTFVRAACAEAMGEHTRKRAIAGVLESGPGGNDADESVDAMIEQLERLATKDRSVDVRMSAVAALGNVACDQTSYVLVDCLKDSNAAVVQLAGNALRGHHAVEFPNRADVWEAYLFDSPELLAERDLSPQLVR